MVEASALGVVVEAVGAAANHHLALVGLRHVAMHRVGHDHHIHAGLDRFTDQRLKRQRFNRQAEARKVGQHRGMAGDDHSELVATDEALRGLDAGDLAALDPDAGHLGLLDHVHAHRRAGACIAPGHGIVPRGAAARLVKRAEDRIARPFDIDDRHQFLDLLRADPLGRDALQVVGIDGALVAPDLMFGLAEHEKAAGGKHDVVVQVLAHRLVERAGLFVDRRRWVLEVVGADDRGVAPGVAAAKPPLLDDGDIGDAEVLAEVIGCRKAVAASADDHHVILRLRRRTAPGAFPVLVIAHRFPSDGKSRIAFQAHANPLPGHNRSVVRSDGLAQVFGRSVKRRNRAKCDTWAGLRQLGSGRHGLCPSVQGVKGLSQPKPPLRGARERR